MRLESKEEEFRMGYGFRCRSGGTSPRGSVANEMRGSKEAAEGLTTNQPPLIREPSPLSRNTSMSKEQVKKKWLEQQGNSEESSGRRDEV